MAWEMPADWVKARDRFDHETAEHEITILRDEGLYRHLRFQKPGSPFYWFDLVTWPGRLVVCGDAGDFMFSRLRDMFEFFEGSRGEINPDYWCEKLQAPQGSGREAARVYSFEVFKARVLEWFEDIKPAELDDDEAVQSLRAALDEQLLGKNDWGSDPGEHEAYERLHLFEHAGQQIYDPSDWNLREYQWSFLWCCWAIVRGIERYRAAVPVEASA